MQTLRCCWSGISTRGTAQDAIALAEAYGFDRMVAEIEARRDGPYEAALADLLLSGAQSFMDGIDGEINRDAILALEPKPIGFLDESSCEDAFVAIADMIDMRMPCTFGHSRAVAALADARGGAWACTTATFARSDGWPKFTTSASCRCQCRRGSSWRRFLRARPTPHNCTPTTVKRHCRLWAQMAGPWRDWFCAITSVSTDQATIAMRRPPICPLPRAYSPPPKPIERRSSR